MKPTLPFLDLTPSHDEIREQLDACWKRISETNNFVGGPEVENFEADWASYCERRHCVGLANGTDSIELILRGLGIGLGDEVVVPANTFVATAEAVTSAGAIPVFADVDPLSLLLTADTLKASLSERTAAVIAVHLFGSPVDMPAINEVAAAHGLAVIEDAAQAHGARWNGQRVGSLSTAASFSFYPGKNLGAFGDGGAVVTDDPRLAEQIRCLANHGRALGSHTDHILDGRNSRLDSLQAAILRVKLSRLDDWNDQRRAVMASYRRHLPDQAELVEAGPAAEPVHHLAVVRVPDRDRVRATLAERGTASGVHYPIPCHRQPAFASYARGELLISEVAATEILSLPMWPQLSEENVVMACRQLAESIERVGQGI